MRVARRAVGLLALVLFAWWATAGGGSAPGAWYPGALLLLAALAACVVPGAYRTLPRPARWALAALAAYTVWSFCSIAWADARGDAWDGANRTLLYLTAFALFAMVPWSPREGAAGLGAFALTTAGIGCWEIAREAEGAFAEGRLAAPVGYENASAAIFLAAFWAALLVAVAHGVPRWARAVLLAAAGVLVELTILAQSRGSLLAGAVTLVLAVALAVDRRSLVLALGALALTTGASLPALLSVYDQAPATPDLTPAAVAIGLSAVVLLAAGAMLEPAGRWVAVHAHVSRAGATTAAAVVAAAGVVGITLAGGPLAGAADSRFAAGPGSGRYDFWSVAALEFVRHPVTGVGADNFAHDYVREREHGEEPLYPHSLVLRAFSQTGIVGAALLAVFLGAVAAAVRRLPLRDAARRSVAVAALVAAAVWVAHGAIDWLWEIPAVGAPAMAFLGLAAGLGPREAAPAAGGRIAAAAVAGVAAVSYALPALSAREVERAVRGWDADPAVAFDRLVRARELNPLSDRPDLVAGALARRAGDDERARRAFLRALHRDPRGWTAQVEVALLDLRDGRRAAALARLEHARALNPREPLIGAALEAAGRGEPPGPALLDELSDVAVPGPIERRPVDCLPVLGIEPSCGPEVVR